MAPKQCDYSIELVFESRQLASTVITFADIAPGESSTKLVCRLRARTFLVTLK